MPRHAHEPGTKGGEEVRLSSRLSIMHLAASAVVIGCMVLGILWLSAEHDRQAAFNAKQMVNAKLASFEERLRATNRDYSVWTEAYQAILDDDMRWLYSNIGTGAAEIGAVDLIVLVPPGKAAPFGWRFGSPEDGEKDLLSADLVATMLGLLSGSSASDMVVKSAYAMVDGEVWLLTVTRVIPVDGVPAGVPDAAIPRQIQGVRIGPDLLEDIRNAFLFEQVELSATGSTGSQSYALDLVNTGGTAAITWKPPRPGTQILVRAAAPLAVIVLFFGTIALIISRYAVTAARRIESALVEARAAERTKTEFLGVVSHELRTPMNGILGLGQVLQEEDLDATQRDLLSMMMNCAQSQMRMIETLLDVTQIESGKRVLNIGPFSLSGLIRQIADVAALDCERKNLSLDVVDETDPAAVLLGDEHGIRQIITNLVDNAIKFTEHGGVTIRVESLSVSRTAMDLRIGISDTGIGIDPSNHARAFERLTQLDGSSARAVEGLGLGLSICQSLVEMMGGRIALDSAPGRGSTFTLVLSLQRAPAVRTLQAA